MNKSIDSTLYREKRSKNGRKEDGEKWQMEKIVTDEK